jgi:hypothetical protein
MLVFWYSVNTRREKMEANYYVYATGIMMPIAFETFADFKAWYDEISSYPEYETGTYYLCNADFEFIEEL